MLIDKKVMYIDRENYYQTNYDIRVAYKPSNLSEPIFVKSREILI